MIQQFVSDHTCGECILSGSVFGSVTTHNFGQAQSFGNQEYIFNANVIPKGVAFSYGLYPANSSVFSRSVSQCYTASAALVSTTHCCFCAFIVVAEVPQGIDITADDAIRSATRITLHPIGSGVNALDCSRAISSPSTIYDSNNMIVYGFGMYTYTDPSQDSQVLGSVSARHVWTDEPVFQPNK